MRKISMLAVAAVATCMTGAAFAADLPRRTAPVAFQPPPPLFTWTGFYAGVNAGASFDNTAGRATPVNFNPANGFFQAAAPGAGFGPFRGANSGTGFVGGGQIGYNMQTGMFVYGLEADIDYFGQGGGKRRSFADSNVFTNGTLTLTRRNDDGYLGTVRGRLGLAAFDRTLLYVTGGLAYGNYGTSYSRARFSDGAGNAMDFVGGGNSDTRVGYALGAGVEYALTQKISVKAEYLYTDLGSRTYALRDNALANPGATTVNVKSDGSSQLARIGLNYKF